MAVRDLTDLQGDGTRLGQTAADKLGFYGLATCVSQRASAVQATSTLSTATSSAVGTAMAATLIEICNTLTGLGLWKGSA